MRQVVLDTETTGLDVRRGHRVIEIGCVEMIERRPTGRHFHYYLNPERDIEAGAQAVHGLSAEFLSDKPLFAEVVDDFIDFIRDSELVIHNADFDVGFLDAELERMGPSYGRVADHAEVCDSLAMARERFPGQRNSLDALCRRFEIDNSHRELHGALLDAQLLAEVYLALTAGQGAFEFDGMTATTTTSAQVATRDVDLSSVRLPQVAVSDAERAAHALRLRAIREASGTCLWLPHAGAGEG
ncbi:MAG TPA: DNA polymerase III subunit epsilon [Xanthomonadaceae bacterium]|nr:DNA polymerase III subunit epsilon [Xanthomonadales bacterium]HPF72190.1 DNA polymerase III subunit epsilon [Xanthomonadaceae bacterium]HRX99407.1 DNA polymerase III subunit epsilon [Xanthomonadaceae bacterium]